MKERRKKRWLTALHLVCGALFIGLAVRGVTWNDQVMITDEAGDTTATTQYRLVDLTDAAVVVRGPDGAARRFARSRVARDDHGDERIQRGLRTAIGSSDRGLLCLAFLTFAPVPFLQSIRFRLMLQAQEIRLTLWECIKLSFGGNFLNFVFMIGSTAGDVFKAYYTALHTPRKTEAVMSIMLDRIIGLIGLLILATGMSWLGSAHPVLRQVGWWCGAFVIIAFGGLLIVMAPWFDHWLERPLFRRLPGSAYVARMHTATTRVVRHKTLLLSAIALSVVLQSVAVGAVVVAAWALQMNLAAGLRWDYFSFIAAGNVIAAIPITAQGLGTMEFAYKQFFLGDYGTLAQLLCLAVWARLLQFFWALPGGLVTLFGAYRPRPDVPISPTPDPALTGSS